MKMILGIVAALALVSSLGTCVMAKSAIHETVGVALLIVSVLAFGFAAILDQLERVNRDLNQQFRFLADFLKERLK
jgi:hypothetical protein